ncbi:MAG TPA: acyltransferase [Phototrophicaceae bacterium]|nr:acyltransferase [Phototrophicaceae bacterium]
MLAQARTTPWKAVNEVRRFAQLPLIRLYFALHGVAWGTGWMIYGCPLIQRHAGSEIRIGSGFNMRNWFGANPLGVTHRSILATWSKDARIELGDDVGMTGATLVAQTRISMSNRVFIGANSTICDTDFHPLRVDLRQHDPTAGASRPIIIEDDVFIGMNSLILKGSHIGHGSVIGAGSVVSGDIPAGVIAAGNPARVIRGVDDP